MTSFGPYQGTSFCSKAGNYIFLIGTFVSSIKFFKVTKRQSIFNMFVSSNAYIILFSRKMSGKLIITMKTFDFIDSFLTQPLSFQQMCNCSNHTFLMVLLETENTSAAFLKELEFGTKVKIWSLFLLFEIFDLAYIQFTR